MKVLTAITPSDGAGVLAPVDPALPAGPQVFEQLKAAILDMTFPPGHPLSEPEIGATLGVSRTPVREAFARLRAIELVMTLPSRGSYVTQLDAAKIKEAQFLREAIEVALVRQLALNGLPEENAAQLRANLENQAAAVRSRDFARFHQCDDAFHLALADATGHRRTAIVLSQEKAQLDRLRMLSLQDETHLEKLFQDHLAIFEAIQQCDPDHAATLTRAHVQAILDVLDSLAQTHENYFSATM
ncbi:MAG: GntR family transcriptional regulator [Pseudomonadota bacterium]